MKNYKYKVYFEIGYKIVYASGTVTAGILAQAERIKDGLVYDVKSIEFLE